MAFPHSQLRPPGLRSARCLALTLALALVPLAPGIGASVAAAAETRAFILTTDFSNGGLSAIDLLSHAVSPDVATVYQDARVRWRDGLLYVINRFGQDNIQEIDPALGYATIHQFSVGNGSNPADILVLSPHKAYVTRYGLASILIMDPQTGATLGQISLASFADADGIPEMDRMIRLGDRVFVSIQRLDENGGFQPTGLSLVAVIDAATDALIDTDPDAPGVQAIALTGTNPATPFAYDTESGRLLIGCVGAYGALDGGIEWIDPFALRSLGFAITETELGGDIAALAWNGAAHSYAIESDASFNTSLVSWSAVTGHKLATLFSPGGFSLGDCGIDDRGQLWVCDHFMAPGIYVFATSNDQMLAGPLDTGLPPNQIAFDHESAVASVPAEGNRIALTAPWPTPARALVRFRLTLTRAAAVRIEALDLSGRRVRAIASEHLAPGTRDMTWDLRDDGARPVSSGIYFVHVKTDGKPENEFVRRVVVVH